MLRKITAFIMVLSLALTFCGCTTLKYFLDVYGNEQDDDTVKIGIFEPLTGIDGEAAGPELSGIMLAHELYPTLFGKKVELIYADNHSNPEHAVVAAKELIDEQVAIVIGSCGNILSMAGGGTVSKSGHSRHRGYMYKSSCHCWKSLLLQNVHRRCLSGFDGCKICI